MNLHRRRFTAALATVALPKVLFAQTQKSLSIEGFAYPIEVNVAGTPLVLNGVGVRQAAWLKGYACGLYLPRKTTSQAEALAMKGPKRVAMRMLVEGPSEEFAKAFKRGVYRNIEPGHAGAMNPRIERFDAIVRGIGTLKKGDAVDVEWRPNNGMVAVVNGRTVGEPVPGEDLFLAMLKIYIGDKPTDIKMKAGLLGQAGKA